MDITEHVDALRRDLAQAARAMGPEMEQAAERLSYAVDASTRLALMEALSHAAAEITNELDGRSVEVRLHGREPVFVVVGSGPPVGVNHDTTVIPEGDTTVMPQGDEGDETSRITLRIPEALKIRAEELASGRGQSLNTWLVNAVRTAAAGARAVKPDSALGPGAPGRNRRSNKRVQGWVR